MRYQILQPSQATFNIRREWSSTDELIHACAPIVSTQPSEKLAMEYVRGLFPDAVVLPAKIPVGSGDVMILGVIADAAARMKLDVDAPMPFTLVVMAQGETSFERKQKKSFDKEVWKLRPVRPSLARVFHGELRAVELPGPIAHTVSIGFHNGRLAFAIELGESQMSFVFDKSDIRINPEVGYESYKALIDELAEAKAALSEAQAKLAGVASNPAA